MNKTERLLPRNDEPIDKWMRRVSRHLNLLSLDNLKLAKGMKADQDSDEQGALDVALMLAPANTSGFEVCASACEGCRAHCVAFSNNGRFQTVINARQRRTRLLFQNRGEFAEQLLDDITLVYSLAASMGVSLAIRLNAFSDLPWERIRMFNDGSTLVDLANRWGIILYDYTKIPGRALKAPYRLTHSRSNETPDEVRAYLAQGVNVAIPFHPRVPDTWHGMPVHNGDLDDRRYKDPVGVIVGLKTKSTACRDATGFVVRV